VRLTTEQYDALIEAGVLGDIELIAGELVLNGKPFDLPLAQRRAAIEAGIDLDPEPGRVREPGALRLRADEFDKLLAMRLFGKVEILDGRMVAGGHWELFFGPEAERAAANAGVTVPGCLDAVLSDPELRERARIAICTARHRP
jgi:hypothetical protein